MGKGIIAIIAEALGIFRRVWDKRNKPEAIRSRAQSSIDKAVVSGDADTLNASLRSNLDRLHDRRGDER